MSRKPANKIAESTHWNKKIATRKKLEAELELLRMFNNENANRQNS